MNLKSLLNSKSQGKNIQLLIAENLCALFINKEETDYAIRSKNTKRILRTA